jgi:hypothetical protein
VFIATTAVSTTDPLGLKKSNDHSIDVAGLLHICAEVHVPAPLNVYRHRADLIQEFGRRNATFWVSWKVPARGERRLLTRIASRAGRLARGKEGLKSARRLPAAASAEVGLGAVIRRSRRTSPHPTESPSARAFLASARFMLSPSVLTTTTTSPPSNSATGRPSVSADDGIIGFSAPKRRDR